ncbi:hypothetical protein [Bacillus sp. 3255]|uniref:hypothetical protein n=1 Tax=Bacillus sp. 3255 TaxID=2817904 RepID=UPI00285EFF3F|nr:hypothetical protein [Bacillus sp. 3255]MDR6881889.1 arginine/ornithine N-succinyltransferase beta subunit [Bacillus sp. 3255]
MSNPNLSEQLEAATVQFKANSPIEAQIRIGQIHYTNEQMRDYLEYKGYEVGDSHDLQLKAQTLNFRFDEVKELWIG